MVKYFFLIKILKIYYKGENMTNTNIEKIKISLENIGYIINECIEKENNGKFWQIKFKNSEKIVNIYNPNNKKNTYVNGKGNKDDKDRLKDIVDKIKCEELEIDPLNLKIVQLINSKKEDYFYDFKMEFGGTDDSFLHDIICLSNNKENKEAYLIYGVDDNYNVVGIEKEIISNNIYDFLKSKHFAGDHIPEIEIKHLFYKSKKIDVVVCKSSPNVPFFLTKRYQSIHEYQIYTRVGDTNTAKNRHASYEDVETLWKIHFDRKGENN